MTTRKLDQPIGITPSDQPAKRKYTLNHTPKLGWVRRPPPHLTPPPQGSADRGNKRQYSTNLEGGKT